MFGIGKSRSTLGRTFGAWVAPCVSYLSSGLRLKFCHQTKKAVHFFLHRAKKEEKAERQIEWTKAGLGLAYVAQETLQQLAIMHGEK